MTAGGIMGDGAGPVTNLLYKKPVNQLFHKVLSTVTTVDIESEVNAIDLNVVDSSGFSIGNVLQIKNGSVETTFPTITDITANNIELDRPLDFAYPEGATVNVLRTNISLDTLSASVSIPELYRIAPDPGQIWYIERVLITMVHSMSGTDDKFGDLDALNNGVLLRGTVNGQTATFTNWKTNNDMKLDMFDVLYSSKVGASKFGTAGRGSFNRIGVSIQLDGNKGDCVDVIIQDDITGLDSLYIKAQGHIKG